MARVSAAAEPQCCETEVLLFLYPVELGSVSLGFFFFPVLSKHVILSDLNLHVLVILQVGSESSSLFVRLFFDSFSLNFEACEKSLGELSVHVNANNPIAIYLHSKLTSA